MLQELAVEPVKPSIFVKFNNFVTAVKEFEENQEKEEEPEKKTPEGNLFFFLESLKK